MRIGTLGLYTQSGNKGCEALAYSFFEVLNKMAEKHGEKIDVVIIGKSNRIRRIKAMILWVVRQPSKRDRHVQKLYPNLRFRLGCYYIRKGIYHFSQPVKSCNFVFDFTAGDSFTDIYGEPRFWERTRLKKAISDSGLKLVLGSQTIGPFLDASVEEYAASVIKQSYEVFVRDEKSYNYTLQISGRKAILTTDIAFVLPFKKQEKKKGGKRVGFNPSGLLWSGGYTRNNQFGLTLDYKEYCEKVLRQLLKEGYEVFLIGHAFDENKLDFPDNDCIAINTLKELIPQLQIAPLYKTPMEIKTFISSMDIFIGARMHATIGSLSAGVPVIPFSYSRKFEGLFESLEYPYIVRGCKEIAEDAISNTLMMVHNRNDLVSAVMNSQKNISDKVKFMYEQYESLIYSTNE